MKRLLCLPILLLAACGPHPQNTAYTGVLEATAIHVPALVGGKILRVLVEEGQEVAPHDTLAIVDATEAGLQKEELLARLEELRIQEEIARTRLDRARTDLDHLTEKHARLRLLHENQALPRQNLDDLENHLRQARSAHTAARQQTGVLSAQKKQLEARLQTIQKKINDALITAPAGGLISVRYFEPGEAIPPLQPIVEILQVRELEVKIYVPEPRLPHLVHGQRVTVRADGLDRETEGRITWISPRAEFTPKNILTPETRTALVYAIRITVPNPDLILKHGMPVEITL